MEGDFLTCGFWIFFGTRIGRMGHGFWPAAFGFFLEHGLDGWGTNKSMIVN